MVTAEESEQGRPYESLVERQVRSKGLSQSHDGESSWTLTDLRGGTPPFITLDACDGERAEAVLTAIRSTFER